MEDSGSPPIVAIVGRPNVGKSTLFNRIIGQRKAIVEDEPGTTRDRSYGTAEWNRRAFVVVDTAGLSAKGLDEVAQAAEEQARLAVEQADLLVQVTDVTVGLTEADAAVADVVRRSRKPAIVAVNKCDSEKRLEGRHEFHSLGLGEPIATSAIHGTGVSDLLDSIAERLPEGPAQVESGTEAPRIAIIGRPNAGKSSLLNRLVGEERALVSEIPGTTRDSLDTPMVWEGREVVLVDTAGLRRRGHVGEGVERHAVLRALASVRRADVCLLVVDATEGATDQDSHIAGYVLETLRGLVVLATKWDLLPADAAAVRQVEETLRFRLGFIAHAPVLRVSSLTGLNIEQVLPTALQVYEGTRIQIPTAQLNRFLREWADRRPPQSRKGSIVRLKYATQTGRNPPTFQVFFNDPRRVHRTYLRYLENGVRREFGLLGVPIRMVARGSRGD